MRHGRLPVRRSWDRSWVAAFAVAAAVGLFAALPGLLVPLARGFQDVCARYPILAILTRHLPPLPAVLLLALAGSVVAGGALAAASTAIRSWRFNRRLDRQARPVPARLTRAAARLGLVGRLTYLADRRATAFCYGFGRPRIAVTAGLVDRLDDEELAAVLAHERHHLRRRDPVRYLALRALTAASFMFPIAPALRRRLETRIELAADRAALAVAPRGALAGALLVVLRGGEPAPVGAAGLTATEARIAHLGGNSELPPIPLGATAASLGLLVLIGAAVADLTTSAQLVAMVCRVCSVGG